MVRDQIGPVADFKRAVVVDRLPKTRSGKVLRSTMQKIADHQDYKLPPTSDDPASLIELAEVLKSPAHSSPGASLPGPTIRAGLGRSQSVRACDRWAELILRVTVAAGPWGRRSRPAAHRCR